VLALVATSLLSGRRGAATGIGGDPRWALLGGGLLAAFVAAGDHHAPLPNLHGLLASVFPGLDAVRGIVRLSSGLQLALTLIAGLGAAVLLRLAGPRGPFFAAALVAIAAFDVLRPFVPLVPGGERPHAWVYEDVRPTEATIAFFDELERRGNRGPLLELPIDTGVHRVVNSPRRILPSAWHHRRTSACFGSYRPAGRDALEALAAKLPSPEAVAGLVELGFTTVVVHRSPLRPDALRIAETLEKSAERGGPLVPIHATPELVAYALHPKRG
jgi:hypothetical protein